MKYLILLSVLVACASDPSQLNERSKSIEIFTTKPIAACHVVGKVVGVDRQGSKDLALNRAMNEGAKLNATGLLVNQEVPNGPVITIYATAYNCDN